MQGTRRSTHWYSATASSHSAKRQKNKYAVTGTVHHMRYIRVSAVVGMNNVRYWATHEKLECMSAQEVYGRRLLLS
jgi:hypothetical protein